MGSTEAPAVLTRRPGLDKETVESWIAGVAAARVRREPPASFPRLPDLPAGRYADPQFFALECDALLKRCWVYAGHTDQLPDVGSFFVRRQGGAPILVVRGEDRSVRAFYNTCRHRGAPVARVGFRLRRGLVHLRLPRLDLRPGRNAEGRAPTCAISPAWTRRAAASFRCAVACSAIGSSSCEDATTESLEDFLEPVARYFRHLPLHDLRLVNQRSLELAGNFKVVLENFLEAYHFRLAAPAHDAPNLRRLGNERRTCWAHGHSMMLTPNRRPNWVDPGTIGMPQMPEATEIESDHNPSYHVFPNLILPISASGMPCVVLWPLSIERTLMEVLWFAPDWGGGPRDPLWDTRIANFDRILDEDIAFVAPIQASLDLARLQGRAAELPGAAHLPLARRTRPAHRRGSHSRALARRAGAWRVVAGSLG